MILYEKRQIVLLRYHGLEEHLDARGEEPDKLTHLVSTHVFLAGLERLEIIHSAASAIARMESLPAENGGK